ncbi:MAG: iron-sulfur cluster assembly accessory protein [Holosporaceae bacterium]|nr:MAG: iron-sulfur cluster assembly accessory protein [Holosporaceae bacterium]
MTQPSFKIEQLAQEKLKDIHEKKGQFLRITVISGGCSGFQYKLDLENNQNPDDVVIVEETAKVVIDPTSFALLEGSELKYVEELIGSYFQVVNPNASESCGCGGSFGL